MKSFLSNRRYELVALAIALVVSAVHIFAEQAPQVTTAADAPGVLNALVRSLHASEGRLTDLKFRLRGARPLNKDVAIVVVDEVSARKHGLWPWSRALVAKGIANLTHAGAKAIALDMTFTDEVPDARQEELRRALTEIDRLQAPTADPKLASLKESLSKNAARPADEVLAEVLRGSPQTVVGLLVYPAVAKGERGELAHGDDLAAGRFLIRAVYGDSPRRLLPNVTMGGIPSWPQWSAQSLVKTLVDAPGHVGFMNVVADPDGPLRRTPLFARLDGPQGLLPNLELATAAAYFGADIEPVYDRVSERLVAARLVRKNEAVATVPLSEGEPFTLIDHLGRGQDFPTLSFADVVDGTFDPAKVAGKAVLVGVTLLGGYDQRVTPFSEYEAGVFVHASFLSNILDQRFLTRSGGLVILEVVLMILMSLGLAIVLPRVNFRWKLVAIAALLLVYLGIDQACFAKGIQLASLMPLANGLLTAFAVIFVGYRSADQDKERLRESFQYRVGKKVMDEMMRHPEKFTRQGERKELSVLFSDIRGFTTIAERMAPARLVAFINEYLTPMTQIVFEEDGTLDKYIGDALMAFWGAPSDQEDHAQRACRAALRMLTKLDELKKMWRAQSQVEIEIGIGINTGEMNVGFMGSDVRGDYTVMGDAVNLGARLEGTNKEYETRVIIAEGTYVKVKDHFVCRRLGAVRVKGKRRPVKIYELRAEGVAQGTEAEALAAFDAAVDAYVAGDFEKCEVHLRRVLELWPNDPPSLRYLEELVHLKGQPVAPGWDGVYTATHK